MQGRHGLWRRVWWGPGGQGQRHWRRTCRRGPELGQAGQPHGTAWGRDVREPRGGDAKDAGFTMTETPRDATQRPRTPRSVPHPGASRGFGSTYGTGGPQSTSLSGQSRTRCSRPPGVRHGGRPQPRLTTALRSTLARIWSTLPSITRGNMDESAPLQKR